MRAVPGQRTLHVSLDCPVLSLDPIRISLQSIKNNLCLDASKYAPEAYNKEMPNNVIFNHAGLASLPISVQNPSFGSGEVTEWPNVHDWFRARFVNDN
jgi:hypothetical protein